VTLTPLATTPQSLDSFAAPDVQRAVDLLLYSLSATSKRIYAHTFALWQQFCLDFGNPEFDLRPENLIAFLESADISLSTKQARLSHLRRLLQALHAAYPQLVAIQAMYEQAKMLKVKRDPQRDTGKERNKTALARQQVYQAFAVWQEDRVLHLRNRALLAVLFYAGLRRSEAAVLRWDDIDLDQRLLTVRHGKGDKARTIPFLGDETPIQLLQDWKAICAERVYVFCGVRKGDHLDGDKPMSDQAVYNVIKVTSATVGVDFAPHDARRTLLTHALAAGSNVRDMQFIAGHAKAETTLRYAIVKDAYEVRGRVKLDY
jgi:integrase/recombinase XerD